MRGADGKIVKSVRIAAPEPAKNPEPDQEQDTPFPGFVDFLLGAMCRAEEPQEASDT